MKKRLLISLFLLFSINYIVKAQETVETTQNAKSVLIGIGIGAKYNINNTFDYKKPGLAFNIEVAKDFWNTGKHFISLEVVGYNYTKEYEYDYKKRFLYFVDFMYKRKNKIYNVLSFEFDLGLGLFSNDYDPYLLGPVINLKINYILYNSELYIKNSFRWSSLFYKEKPWIITAGISTKI